MTKAEMNTLGDLVTAMTQAEISLTQAQQKVGEALDLRDSRRRAYYDFLASIPVSDAPAEVKPERKKRIDAGIKRKHSEGCTCPVCDPAPSASQTTLSEIEGEQK